MWWWNECYWTTTHQPLKETCIFILNLLEIHSHFLIFKLPMHYMFRPIWSSTSSSDPSKNSALPSINTIPKYTFIHASACSLLCVGIAGWWLLCCLVQMLSCDLLWKAGHTVCEQSSFNDNNGRQKISSLQVMYQNILFIIYNWTRLCKNCRCIAVSHNSTLWCHKHFNHLE